MGRTNRCKNWTHTNWPEPWQSAWKVAVRTGDAFRAGGPATELSPRTVWNDEMAFGRYQQFLAGRGMWDGGSSVSLDKLRAFSNHLAETLAPYTVLALLKQVLAAERLMSPVANLAEANRAVERFANGVRPVRVSGDRWRRPRTIGPPPDRRSRR